MSTTATVNAEPGAPSPEPGPLLKRSPRRMPHGVWYGLAALGVAVIVFLLQLAFYMRRSEPRDARAIVERELRMNTLVPGERIVRTVKVFRRDPADYFRQTRGLLVLTDRRLLYLGAPPRDITGATDAPPTFDQREFPFDTLTHIESSFAVLGLARALDIETPAGDVKVGVASGEWQKAKLLQQAWSGRHARLAMLGEWAARVREARATLASRIEEYRRQPLTHVVRPGDAISSIAAWYETTPEEIRRQNAIEGNKIKVGQRLVIKPGS